LLNQASCILDDPFLAILVAGADAIGDHPPSAAAPGGRTKLAPADVGADEETAMTSVEASLVVTGLDPFAGIMHVRKGIHHSERAGNATFAAGSGAKLVFY
jgi:hypothetical protein